MTATFPARTESYDEEGIYPVIVFNGEGTQIVLEELHGKHVLPVVRIPRLSRPTEHITCHLRSAWKLPAVLLFFTPIEDGIRTSDRDVGKSTHYATMEALREGVMLRTDVGWHSVRGALARIGRVEAEFVRRAHEQASTKCNGADPAPFSRFGWMRRLEGWINGVVHDRVLTHGEIVHLNGGGGFSLVRFETNDKPLWFKAVGGSNLREYPITVTLAQLFPDFLPTMIAFEPTIRGWLMEDVCGPTLRDSDHTPAWHTTVERLADLQLRSIPYTNALLEAGCLDLRIPFLKSLVNSFFDLMVTLMEQQQKSSPAPLTRGQLCDVASSVSTALQDLESLEIPDALCHRDFNPGNILVGDDRCAFTDWAEGCVGHPFLTFEYLLAFLRKSAHAASESRLRE